jgi:predicted transposase YbfD/YdcC
MRCTAKKTVKAIIDKGCDYLIAVKKNQPKLHGQIQRTSQECVAKSKHVSRECTRDRQTKRVVRVFDDLRGIAEHWVGIKSLIEVKRTGMRGGKAYKQMAYYISSVALEAEAFAQAIRGHWHIENRLHWVKDVVLREDSSRIRNEQAAGNFSLVRSMVMNLLRIQGYSSITQAQRQIAHDIDKLCSLLE